jgi:pimeloyl-ACP methyl ester carboxylesterase
MPTFIASDGTRLAYHVSGVGEPLLCLPGGMRAAAYLGDLGGLSGYRTLIRLDLRGTGDSAIPQDPSTFRCDRQVADVEALREHLGIDRADILAHSAAGDLAILYAAQHPQHVRSLTLLTARARALGVDFTEEHRREAVALRSAEPWFEPARRAFETVVAGQATDADWDAIGPFFYGRWDAAAQAHHASGTAQSNPAAAAIYASAGAFDPAATRTAIGDLTAPVLIYAGEVDMSPRPRVAAAIAQLFPRAQLVVQPGGGHLPWLDDPGYFTRTIVAFTSAGSGRP